MTPAQGTKLVRESEIEAYLDLATRRAGGITRKFTCPGRSGVPDRIVILCGYVMFVEVKAPNGKLTALQEREHQVLRENGAVVTTVYSREGVDTLLRNVS